MAFDGKLYKIIFRLSCRLSILKVIYVFCLVPPLFPLCLLPCSSPLSYLPICLLLCLCLVAFWVCLHVCLSVYLFLFIQSCFMDRLSLLFLFDACSVCHSLSQTDTGVTLFTIWLITQKYSFSQKM